MTKGQRKIAIDIMSAQAAERTSEARYAMSDAENALGREARDSYGHPTYEMRIASIRLREAIRTHAAKVKR